MPKGYVVVCYRSVKDPAKLAAYAKISAQATQAAGGRILARGVAAKAVEQGLAQRTVVIEFDSLDKALAAYDSPGYKEALRVLGDGAERDFRFIEGV